MAFDDISGRFTGTAAATTAATTVTAATTQLGLGREIGAERLFLARLYVVGTATTGDTLNVKFQDSTTQTGTYTDLGYAFSAWTMAATGNNTTMAMGLQIHTTGSVLATDDPLLLSVRTRAGKPWVRVFVTPGATAGPLTYAVVSTPIDRPAF